MMIAVPSHRFHRASAVLLLLIGTATVDGCASARSDAVSPPTPNGPAAPRPADTPEVIRSGRYRLAELSPDGGQQDLMAQMIDVSIPATLTTSVIDALHYVLQGSGYQLCDQSEDVHAFDLLPLPAVHTHLGPLTLRDALQILVGPAWQIQVDDTTRRVCFTRRDKSSGPGRETPVPPAGEPWNSSP